MSTDFPVFSRLRQRTHSGCDGQHGMLTPPWHLTLPLSFSKGPWLLRFGTFSWIPNCRLFFLLFLDHDIFFLNYDNFPDNDILYRFDIKRTAGVTGRQMMLPPTWHLILSLILTEIRVLLCSCFVFSFGLLILKTAYHHMSYIYFLHKT